MNNTNTMMRHPIIESNISAIRHYIAGEDSSDGFSYRIKFRWVDVSTDSIREGTRDLNSLDDLQSFHDSIRECKCPEIEILEIRQLHKLAK